MMSIFECKYYDRFEQFLEEKYPSITFTPEEKQEKFEDIFLLGLHKAKQYHKINRASNLLFRDKRPRADMIQKLGHILFELQRTTPSFPVVPPLRLRAAIKKVIISGDKRYMNKYQEWILSYSNHQPTFNKVDMTDLLSLFPKEKIIERELW